MLAVRSKVAAESDVRKPERRKKTVVQKVERVSVSVSLPFFEKLEGAQRLTHASNLNEVFRSAAKLYLVLLEEQRLGNDVFVMSKDGTKTRYPIFSLD